MRQFSAMRQGPLDDAPLVGRDAELTALRAAIEHVLAGDGSTVYLLGEAGIGKTALLEALLDEARARGMAVLDGRAWPVDAGLSYAPIVQAIGAWLRALEPAQRQELVDGLPELSRLFGELGMEPSPSLGDPALDRTRLFEAVARLLERYSELQPMVLAIDDLHHADEASTEIFHHLARRLFGAPLLLVAAARPAVLDEGAGVHIHHATRSGTAQRIVLSRLEATGVRAIVERMLGGEAAQPLVDLVVERADGTPFFVVALVAALARRDELRREGGIWQLGPGASRVVPSEAKQLVSEHLRRVDAPQRTVLEHLAVGGAEVGFETLAAACSLDRDALVDALGGLCERGLASESTRSDGSIAYAIRTPLAQEAIYELLPAQRRREAHRRFLAASGTGEEPAVRARHVLGVGTAIDDPAAALAILLDAGCRAQSRLAYEEAARWYSAALTIARSHGTRAQLRSILTDLGSAWSALWEPAAAVELWSEALDLAEQDEDVHAAATLRSRMSFDLWALGRLDESFDILRRGVAALEPRGPSSALAHLYEASFVNAWRRGDRDWVRDKADALAAWDEAPDLDVGFEIEVARVHQLLARGQLVKACERAALAAGKARSLAQRLRIMRLRVTAALAAGIGDEACVRDYQTTSAEAGIPSLGVPVGVLVGQQRFNAGDLAGAAREYREVLADRPFGTQPRAVVGVNSLIATVEALRGRFEEARRALGRAASAMTEERSDAHVQGSYQAARAALAIGTDDAELAQEAAEEMPEFFELGIHNQALRAEAWLLAGDLERASQEVARLEATDVPFARAAAQRVGGLVALSRGDDAAARAALCAAASGFEAAGMPLAAAQARLERAELATVEPEEAVAGARRALEAFERSGAERWRERAVALLRRHGERAPRTTPKREDRPLSARELEVARLAARGLTNAAIGRRLFISPHTAATHLKRIYANTGVPNRAALGKWLRERGLDEGGG